MSELYLFMYFRHDYYDNHYDHYDHYESDDYYGSEQYVLHIFITHPHLSASFQNAI